MSAGDANYIGILAHYGFVPSILSVQRDKAHRLGGGFSPLTGAAVGYAFSGFSSLTTKSFHYEKYIRQSGVLLSPVFIGEAHS